MNDDNVDLAGSDPGFERLRASDPAGSATPDVGRIRAAVDSRISATPIDEVAARRSRSRKPWYAGAAAVVAGAVIIGSGGFALGTVASGSSNASNAKRSTPTFVPANGAPGTNSEALGVVPAPMDSSTFAPHSRALGSGKDVGGAAWQGPIFSPAQTAAGTVFVASSTLSSSPGTSTAYAYAASQVDPVALTTSLARALNTKHKVVLSWDHKAYVAKTRFQALTVHIDGVLSFNYYQLYGHQSCTPAVYNSGGSVASALSTTGTKNSPCPAPHVVTDPKSVHALSVSRHVMRDAGIDPARYRWRASANLQSGYVTVTAVPTVGGHQLAVTRSAADSSWGTTADTSWHFIIEPTGGIDRLYGALAPVVSLGDYRVVSQRSAVDRLNQSRYLTFLSSKSDPALETPASSNWWYDSGASGQEWLKLTPSPKPTLPSVPAAGSKLQWPVSASTIVRADLGLAAYGQSNGAVVLMPTYTLTDAAGLRYSVLAVGSDALDSAAP